MPNLTCKVCGTEFPPIRERHYISRDLTKTGLATAFGSFNEPAIFDSYDCPCCGSQVIAQPRKYIFDWESEETTDKELLNEISSKIFEHQNALLNIVTPDEKDLKLTNPLGVDLYPTIKHVDIDFKKRPSSLYFDSEDEAWIALKTMRKIVEENGFISLSEANEALGGHDCIVSRWGWTDLSKAHLIQAKNCSGFYISFPAICDRPASKEASNEL